MTFQQKLDDAVSINNSLLCVGLDTDIEKIPEKFKNDKFPQFSFNQWIIDQTHKYVCCYKPNSAFYEARGVVGIEELKMTIDYLHKNYKQIPIILDCKRGDIGNTNEQYAKFVYVYLGVDAVTLHPYQGIGALSPFLEYTDKGNFILCKTSNPEAGEFQDIELVQHHSELGSRSNQKAKKTPSYQKGQGNKMKLYELAALNISTKWNSNNNCMLVVGATYPEELGKIRKIVGDMTILVPGIGVQGGTVEKTVKAGLNSKKAGLILNASRAILFSSNPHKEAKNLRDAINIHRT